MKTEFDNSQKSRQEEKCKNAAAVMTHNQPGKLLKGRYGKSTRGMLRELGAGVQVGVEVR